MAKKDPDGKQSVTELLECRFVVCHLCAVKFYTFNIFLPVLQTKMESCAVFKTWKKERPLHSEVSQVVKQMLLILTADLK
jgi:hypothetical protein